MQSTPIMYCNVFPPDLKNQFQLCYYFQKLGLRAVIMRTAVE